MKIEPPLLLALKERNLAHFLSALALAGLAARIPGAHRAARRYWWMEEGHFAIESEFSADHLRQLLFEKAYEFIRALRWIPGIGGEAHGALVSGSEVGINPFIALSGDADERPLLRTFSARVVPAKTLPQQILELKSPADCEAWLDQIACGDGRQVEKGVSSWGFDCRVNAHASDSGISSDAEGTGINDPIFPAIELLSVAAAAFFVPVHAWRDADSRIQVAAWTKAIPIEMVALAGARAIHGLPARVLTFASRGSAHGQGRYYRFFPEATIAPNTKTT